MNIGETIPQFFYDLIARIIPGLVFIFCFCFTFDQVYYLKRICELSNLSLLAFAYVVGALFHGPCLWFNYSFFKKDNEKYLIQALSGKSKMLPFPAKVHDIVKQEMAKEFSSQKGEAGFEELVKNGELTNIIFIWFDKIRKTSLPQGFRIAKIRAEYHSASCLFFILLIFAPIMFRKLSYYGINGLDQFLIAIFIFLSIWGSYYVNKRLRHLHSDTILRTYYNMFIQGQQIDYRAKV